MAKTANDKIALSVAEAAELLGLSRPSVYRLMRCEGFPCFKLGTRTLISRSGLEEWVRRQAERSAVI